MKSAIILIFLAAATVADQYSFPNKGILTPEKNARSTVSPHSELAQGNTLNLIQIEETCNKPIYKFFGQKRNGNHVAIDWILNKIDEKSFYFNCMIPEDKRSEAKYGAQHWLASSVDEVTYWNECMQARPKNVSEKEDQLITNYNVVPCKQIDHQICAPVMMSFENYYFNDVADLVKISKEANDFGAPGRIGSPNFNIAIVRDPFNAVASYYMLLRTNGLTMINAFKEIKSNYMPEWKKLLNLAIIEEDNNVVGMNYNKFVSSREYRDSIAKKLNFTRERDNLSDVSKAGGGSSFDLLDFKGHGTDMKTDERYLEEEFRPAEGVHRQIGRHTVFLEDPLYLDIFKSDPELLELSKLHFGIDPFKGG